MKINCVVLGGGGHARVLIECIQAGGDSTVAAVLDRASSLWGTKILGVPIPGGDDLLLEMVKRGVTHFAVGLGSVGSSKARARLFELGLSHSLTPLTVKHLSAVCSRWVEVGLGAQLFPGCIVNAGAKLGTNVIVNSGAVVEHDCNIGAHAHVATGARLSGGVLVGSGAHIGAGATIRQCVNIGDNAIVGAGAVVVKDVLPNMVVVGVPAQVLRAIDQDLD